MWGGKREGGEGRVLRRGVCYGVVCVGRGGWGATSFRISGLPAESLDMKELRTVSELPPPPPPPPPLLRGGEGASSLELAQPISVTTRATR